MFINKYDETTSFSKTFGYDSDLVYLMSVVVIAIKILNHYCQ